MEYSYKTHGVCSRSISFTIDETDNRIHNVVFTGGCNGNTQGVSVLIEGMDAEEAIHRLRGIRCGARPTSCPDQLAQALEAAEDSIAQKNSAQQAG